MTIPIVPKEIKDQFAKIKCPVSGHHSVISTIFVRSKSVSIPAADSDRATFDAFCVDCQSRNGAITILKSYQLLP